MQQFTPAEWQSWERFYRANFINSLTGFKSASLIGTMNAQGVPNLGMFSSMVHIGSDPALIGYINRPVAAAPHTLANIKANGFYTVNHIHPAFLAQAHQTSAKYAVNENEFDATGLSIQYKKSLLKKGTLIDLTGGFGVDDYYFAQKFNKVVHCEINEELSKILDKCYEFTNWDNTWHEHVNGQKHTEVL